MEPNKFEKHIKKQMQKREIKPSADAWEKVSAQLEVSDKPKHNRVLWYSIAACFIGLLIASVVYFNLGNSADAPNVQIVDGPERTDLPKEGHSIDFRDMREDIEGIVAIDSIEKVSAEEEVVSDSSKIEHKKEGAIAINMLVQEDSVDHKMELPKESIYKVEGILNAKILEVVAKVNSLENQNVDLTDAEVDSLLRKAQTEIVANKVIQNADTVDPMALLTDVEDQLDRSFRDKLFERLKTGFVKVRTAVADSDN